MRPVPASVTLLLIGSAWVGGACVEREVVRGPAPSATPTPKASTSAKATADAGNDAPPAAGVTPLQEHRLAWAPKGSLLAADEWFGCGMPMKEATCKDVAALRVVDVMGATKSFVYGDADLFGFRADGQWIVIRDRARTHLEEWSPRTGELRPSAFATRVKGAQRLCLSTDDVHFLVVVGTSVILRSRASEQETALEVEGDPTDCAFSQDGKKVALAMRGAAVAVYMVGEERPFRHIPIGNAGLLSWTKGGDLSFVVKDMFHPPVALRWNLTTGSLNGFAARGLGAFDAQGGFITRDNCEWMRYPSGSTVGLRLGPVAVAGSCFADAKDILASLDGRAIAALEGGISGRRLEFVVMP